MANTHLSPEPQFAEEYRTVSLTAQFSIENELPRSTTVEKTKNRTSSDTCIDIAPTNLTNLHEQAQKEDIKSEIEINNDKNYTSQFSSTGLSEETPILLANRIETQNAADISNTQDSSTTCNGSPNVANETT